MNNTLDLSKYTVEDFKRFSIFELRDIAAFFGVKAPTSHSKSDLVLLIDDARRHGGLTLDTKKPRRGRPQKAAQKDYFDKSIASEDAATNAFYVAEGSVPFSEQASSIGTTSTIEQFGENTAAVSAETPKPVKQGRNFLDIEEALLSLKSGDTRQFAGILELNPKGFGFIRSKYMGNDQQNDAHIDNHMIRTLNLRSGDHIKGLGKKEYEDKSATIQYVLEINGVPIGNNIRRPMFDNLVPIFPDSRLVLESPSGRTDTALRCIDLVAPIGKGQRALIVSPPKAGKTTILKQIANSITRNYPMVKVFILLIDERPEEVTDMQRSINADVIYSTFDEQPEHHIKMAETVLECAKRYVESGRDAVIILDSLTRLARAYNATVTHSGRALSGGLDATALAAPKRFFGSARNIENGGSLTIIATALIETNSRLDEVIFEEFKGTGNMEVVLDRKLSERRVFPAIDLAKSGTRREDLLLSQSELSAMFMIRNTLDSGSYEAIEGMYRDIYDTKSNNEMIAKYNILYKNIVGNGYNFMQNTKPGKGQK